VLRVTAGVQVVALALLCVASTPHGAAAQAASGAVQVVRHDLAGAIGVVTRAEFSPARRAAVTSATDLPGAGELAGRLWELDGTVRTNAPARIVAERSERVASGEGPAGWQVRTADGRLVPWLGDPLAVSDVIAPGRTAVRVHFVAPSAAAGPPPVRLRVVAQ
jgi:hypothetical protein